MEIVLAYCILSAPFVGAGYITGLILRRYIQSFTRRLVCVVPAYGLICLPIAYLEVTISKFLYGAPDTGFIALGVFFALVFGSFVGIPIALHMLSKSRPNNASKI